MSRIFKNELLATLVLAMLTIKVMAQLPTEVSAQLSKLTPMPAMKSPNVASMEKYGDYNVNLYTGLPEISIPLFEITSGSLSLPITLNYHASGFKYTDQASWVGLGWSVQAGGQISRSFQGKPDEASFLTLANDYSVPGAGDCNYWTYKESAVVYGNDHEPDLFNYTLPGLSGKFYLQQGSASPYLVPFNPIKIQRYNTIDYFDITNDRGVVHRFGANWAGSLPAREGLYSQSGGNTTSGVVAWHLQEMKSPNTDDYISISYQTVGTIQNSDFEYNLAVLDQCNTNNPTNLPCPSSVGTEQQVSTSSSTTQLGINEILFKNGKVRFVMGGNRTDLLSSNGIKKLDRIEVYRKEGSEYFLIKSYHFVTSYFRNYDNSADSYLRLDHVEVKDGSGTFINRHSFSYHTSTIAWSRPDSGKARDFFGFYNGKVSNTTLIPSTTIQYQPNVQTAPSNITIGSADRSTDTTFLKNGVLKRITFPTMGYTEFDFEPHRYNEGGVTTYVPGLRVKKITTFDGAKLISKAYKYGSSENGLGHKNFDLRGFYFYSEQLIRNACSLIPCDREYRSRMFFSNSVIGPGYEDAPIVYSIATEYQNGTNANGRTVFEFDNNTLIGDPLFSVPYSNKTFRNSMSWARGKLTRKTVYNSEGTQVAQTNVSYTNYGDQTSNIGQSGYQWIVGRWGGYLYVNCGNSVDGKEINLMNLAKTTGNYKETTRSETLNFSGVAQTTTTTKAFNPTYLQPTYEEQIVSSNPEIVRTSFRYPFDIVNTSSTYTGLPDALKQMLLKNMLAYPVEQYTWVKPTSGSTQQIVGGQVTEYDLIPGTNFYQSKYLHLLEVASLGSSYTTVQVSGSSALTRDGRYKLRLTMDSYDTRGNLLQYSVSDGQIKSFLYAYEGQYAVAEATNSPGSTLAFTSFETNEKGGWTYSGPESRVMQGEGKTGNSVYLLNNGDITKAYKGAYKLSLWVRKNTSSSASLTINGVDYGSQVGTSWKLIEVTGSGGTITISGSNTMVDELRVHAAAGMATSFTILPMVGILTQLDSKNLGTYYRYDPFGRLETVRNEDGHLLNLYDYIYIKP
ncbi:hypothetical protein [Algoriphagus sp.]|uniref:hypothetical protein n=3 Tax=Algoriphagus sp. TaxID=1872435 RepID=UPI0027316F31|nr:hypothetical protein [Algoriphagus sp.]MDP2042698.1 hypothetical protein [Algoriphagus sp.]